MNKCERVTDVSYYFRNFPIFYSNKYTRATNNCLIKKRLLDKCKDIFDPEYGLRSQKI